MSKRQKVNNKAVLKKPATTPFDIVRGYEDVQDLREISLQGTKAELAWQAAVSAALELLKPSDDDESDEND